jgi:hypothetical protein
VKFGSHLYEWNETTKGKEKKAPESVNYWTSSLSKEIEAEIDIYLQHVFAERDNSSATISFPTIDYETPGFERGVTVLYGGDHGNEHCPISCKLNLTSPAVRKEKKELGYHCPLFQFASVKCTKETYELMKSTVMPKVKEQIIQVRNSSVVTIYHRKGIDEAIHFRSYMVPSTIDVQTIAFIQNGPTKMTFAYGNKETPNFGTVVVDDEDLLAAPYFELKAHLVVSRFNELVVGDLAFLAMILGMNNSSGYRCVLCTKTGAKFNCDHNSLEPRTKALMEACLAKYMDLSRNETNPPPNYKGVNAEGLWDVDPRQLVVPILHCPMGLVDKLLEALTLWFNMDIEDLQDDVNTTIRSDYKDAKDRSKATTLASQHAKSLMLSDPASKDAHAMYEAAEKLRKAAKKEEARTKAIYSDMIQRHNAKQSSLKQKLEEVYRQNGIKREHYHGGKFNGVNCIRVMEKAELILLQGNDNSPAFLQHCIALKEATVTVETIQNKLTDFSKMLGILDAIWSSVRGVDCGLLPSPQQLQTLKTLLQEGKALWLKMELGTLQPKWHLTFDGHLYYQVSKFGGLADKSDESIEKGHQTLKTLRERFRRISSYEKRENCIRRELRRGRSQQVQAHIATYEAAVKQRAGTKRAIETAERLANKRQVKDEKRSAYTQQPEEPP